MQQEINLCLLLPEQKKTFLTPRLLAISNGVFIGLLFLHLCVGWWSKHQEMLQLATLSQALNQVELQMARIHEQYPMLDSKDMEASLSRLQADLQFKNTLFNMLSTHNNFSNVLVGVAKAVGRDLWVTDIQEKIGDQDLTLKGYALNSNAIQEFINHLALQKEFSGLNFQLQEMVKTELDKEVVLRFIISTKVTNESTG